MIEFFVPSPAPSRPPSSPSGALRAKRPTGAAPYGRDCIDWTFIICSTRWPLLTPTTESVFGCAASSVPRLLHWGGGISARPTGQTAAQQLRPAAATLLRHARSGSEGAGGHGQRRQKKMLEREKSLLLKLRRKSEEDFSTHTTDPPIGISHGTSDVCSPPPTWARAQPRGGGRTSEWARAGGRTD